MTPHSRRGVSSSPHTAARRCALAPASTQTTHARTGRGAARLQRAEQAQRLPQAQRVEERATAARVLLPAVGIAAAAAAAPVIAIVAATAAAEVVVRLAPVPAIAGLPPPPRLMQAVGRREHAPRAQAAHRPAQSACSSTSGLLEVVTLRQLTSAAELFLVAP